jgi:adenosylcobinamide-phosphate synthase
MRVWLRDACLTESPNAGQPMAAAAGQLDVRLEKVGHYQLNAEARPPNVDAVSESRRLVARGMVLTGILALIVRRVLHP